MATASGAFVGARLGSFVESHMHGRDSSSLSASYHVWVQTAAWGAVAYRVGIEHQSGSPTPSQETLTYPGTLSSLAIPSEADDLPAQGYDSSEYNQTCWRRVKVDVVSTPDPNSGTGTSENHWEYTEGRCVGYIRTSLDADQLHNVQGQGTYSTVGSEQHWADHGGYVDGSGIDNPAENGTESGTNSYGESVTKACVSSASAIYFEWTITTAGGTTVYRITYDTPLAFDDFLIEAVDMYESIEIPGGTSSSTSPGRQYATVATSTGVYEEDSVFAAPIQDYANENDIPGGGIDMPSVTGRASAGMRFGTNGISVVVSGVRYRFAGEQPAKYIRTCGVDGARDSAASEKLEYFADKEVELAPTEEMKDSFRDDVIATQIQLGGISSYTSTTPDFPVPS